VCIICYNPSEATITKEVLERCFVGNPNGAGYMFAREGSLVIRKPFFTFDELMTAINADDVMVKGTPCVFHFRITTHGENNKINTHPHRINADLAMVHNGIISQFAQKNHKFSDTVMFMESILKKLPEDWFYNQAIYDLINAYMEESRSKLAIMDSGGQVAIYNEAEGDWDKASGCWFSNTSYKYRYAQTSYYNTWRGGSNFSTATSTPATKHNYGEYTCKACDGSGQSTAGKKCFACDGSGIRDITTEPEYDGKKDETTLIGNGKSSDTAEKKEGFKKCIGCEVSCPENDLDSEGFCNECVAMIAHFSKKDIKTTEDKIATVKAVTAQTGHAPASDK